MHTRQNGYGDIVVPCKPSPRCVDRIVLGKKPGRASMVNRLTRNTGALLRGTPSGSFDDTLNSYRVAHPHTLGILSTGVAEVWELWFLCLMSLRDEDLLEYYNNVGGYDFCNLMGLKRGVSNDENFFLLKSAMRELSVQIWTQVFEIPHVTIKN